MAAPSGRSRVKREEPGASPAPGPPPLRPFGLVLRHDGSWLHEGEPVLHPKLRAAFDGGVRFLPDEGETGKYVVTLGYFRGQIEVEEAAFFVRDFDSTEGTVVLSDGSREPLDVASLHLSPVDQAILCRVKRALAPEGLLARFTHAAHAELLAAVDDASDPPALWIRGVLEPLPDL